MFRPSFLSRGDAVQGRRPGELPSLGQSPRSVNSNAVKANGLTSCQSTGRAFSPRQALAQLPGLRPRLGNWPGRWPCLTPHDFSTQYQDWHFRLQFSGANHDSYRACFATVPLPPICNSPGRSTSVPDSRNRCGDPSGTGQTARGAGWKCTDSCAADKTIDKRVIRFQYQQ